MSLTETIPFGLLLKQLRKHAGMTQRDLAAALNCSNSLISSLERAQRQPDLQAVITWFIPALGLQDDPVNAAHLIERAAAARGERPPASVTFQRALHIVIQEDLDERREGLSSQPTNLIGRTAEVNHLCNRLMGHSGRLLTLVGPPGIGKTRLAFAIAAHLQLQFPDGTAFVPLAEINDAELMAFTIAATLGSSDASPKPPKTRLIDFLRRKMMLLVLDNCEQIRDASLLVAEMLAACAGLIILATSRERLHLRAEQRYRVPPLELGHAVELFTQRAAAVDANFVLSETHRATIEAICQRLDRLPLALELCASQTDLLSPTQILAQLQNRRLDLLVDGAHDFPARHRTLRHAIQSSYVLLSEEERMLFRTLGIFTGGFALPELEVIISGSQESRIREDPSRPLSTLHALIGKSLVRAEMLPSGEQRFWLLEIIREFALEQVRTQGEEAWLRKCHYTAYLELFRRGDSHLRGPESRIWFERLVPEQDNLRAALQWAFDEGHYVDAAWLLLAVTWFWYHRGHWYEQNGWIEQLLPHRHLLDANLRLAILLNLWAVARVSVEFQPVDHWEQEVMQLLDLCPHPLMHAAAWHFTGAYSYNNLPKASMAWARAIAFARAASESPPLSAKFGILADLNFYLGLSLWGLADRLIEYGKFTQALPLLSESLAIFQARGSRYESINILGALGRMAFLQGDLAQAYKLLNEAVTISTEFNYHEMLGYLQAFLGLATLYNGTISAARRILSENHNFCIALKDKGLMARNSIYLAETALSEGLLDEAEQWLMQSFAYYSSPRRVRIDQLERLFVAARLAADQQHYLRAATLFGLAEQIRSYLDYVVTGPRRLAVETALATVEVALDQAVFAESFAIGQRIPLEEAYTTILLPPSFTNIATTYQWF